MADEELSASPQNTLASNQQLLDAFPPVAFAFAYGSAVYPQRGYSRADLNSAMTDLIFAVDDPLQWHTLNMERNSSHYSALGALGPSTVAAMQERIGAGIYYNALIPVRGRMVKYGVMSTSRLADDLRNWSTLYVSGRMHKPIQVLLPNEKMQLAQACNLRSALSAALILQPPRMNERALFKNICGLSYGGDVRLRLVENRKVADIVDAQLAFLRAIYAEPMQELISQGHLHAKPAEGSVVADTDSLSNLSRIVKNGEDVHFEQDESWEGRERLLLRLPRNAKSELIRTLSGARTALDSPNEELTARLSEAARALWQQPHATHATTTRAAPSARLADALQSSLKSIVHRPSVTQTLKGILTAGGTRSMQYVSSKLIKHFRR